MTTTIEKIEMGNNEQTLQGKTFCVTGKLEKYTREQVWEAIKNHGGGITKTVQSATNYVIVGTIKGGFAENGTYSHKLNNAVNRGISVISEWEFEQMLIGA